MSREHVTHTDIVAFAKDRVNLPKDIASEYREQVNRLRDKLEGYLADHPDFTLKKMILSGSLAKGTSLRSLNDIDVACYVSGADAPGKPAELVDYLAARLKKAFPNFTDDQIQPQTYSVTVTFKGSGLNVDIVPILYDGNTEWFGNLISQDDGTFLKTNIPYHLDFISKRKKQQETHFSQVVRLVKFWAKIQKAENDQFRFKSFMIEMILAKLADQGLDFSDYPEALQHFFTYISKTEIKEKIIFNDYYQANAVSPTDSRVRIFDPVNPQNNVAKLYTQKEADLIVNAALDAGDAIDAALAATTKQKTVYYWQKVFGTTFQA